MGRPLEALQRLALHLGLKLDHDLIDISTDSHCCCIEKNNGLTPHSGLSKENLSLDMFLQNLIVLDFSS
jgi:hypothetical protein